MASAFLSFIAAFMLLQLVNSEEYCAMYDVCGKRSDGVVLNCPYGSPPVEPDKLFSAQIQSLCPTMTGNVCCNELQFQTLQLRVELATKFLGGCPACLRNYLNLFCELSCSPNQSRYVDVTSVSKVTGNMIVARVDYYISDTFGQGLYNSCKDVKFGGSRSMDMVGAGAKKYEEWFDVLGKKSSPAVPAPPYVIEFKFPTSESSNIQFMNVSAYSCADTSLHCSCDDCPSRCSRSIYMLRSIIFWPIEVTLMLPTLQDCGQLAWGIAYFMGSCSWWIVKVYFRICWDPRFFFGIILGLFHPELRMLFIRIY